MQHESGTGHLLSGTCLQSCSPVAVANGHPRVGQSGKAQQDRWCSSQQQNNFWSWDKHRKLILDSNNVDYNEFINELESEDRGTSIAPNDPNSPNFVPPEQRS